MKVDVKRGETEGERKTKARDVFKVVGRLEFCQRVTAGHRANILI